MHADLDGNKVVLPVMGQKFLFEFEEELGVGECSEMCKIGIDPGLNVGAFKVVDDRLDAVLFSNRFMLRKVAASILPNAYSCDCDMACQ